MFCSNALFDVFLRYTKRKKVTVSNVEITGFIKDYIRVVDGSYKFTNDGSGKSTTSIKFRTSK